MRQRGILARCHAEKFAAIAHEVALVEIERVDRTDPLQARIEHEVSQAAHEPLAPQQLLGSEAERLAAQSLERARVQPDPLGHARHVRQLGIEQHLVHCRDPPFVDREACGFAGKEITNRGKIVRFTVGLVRQPFREGQKPGKHRLNARIVDPVGDSAGRYVHECGPTQREEADPPHPGGDHAKLHRHAGRAHRSHIGAGERGATFDTADHAGVVEKAQPRPFGLERIIDRSVRAVELDPVEAGEIAFQMLGWLVKAYCNVATATHARTPWCVVFIQPGRGLRARRTKEKGGSGGTALSLSLWRESGGQSCLGLSDNGLESRAFVHREVGHDLAVELDPGQLGAVHEL